MPKFNCMDRSGRQGGREEAKRKTVLHREVKEKNDISHGEGKEVRAGDGLGLC